MINVTLFKKNQTIVGFKIKNHGKDIVCSAVSILSLNTINSIEQFSDIKFDLNYNSQGGFIDFCINYCEDLPQKFPNATLLLKSFELGINGIYSQYSNEITVNYEEV